MTTITIIIIITIIKIYGSSSSLQLRSHLTQFAPNISTCKGGRGELVMERNLQILFVVVKEKVYIRNRMIFVAIMKTF